MKKLLFGVLCASACAASAVETTIATVEVRAVNSGLTNTVVAIPGLDLATGGAIAISNLVKTTNLAEGDRLVAFTNNKYESWELNASKIWVKNSKLIDIGADGSISDGEGTASDLKTLGVGCGIWLSRRASGVSSPFYVYAQQPDTTNTTVAAGTTALVGNPTTVNKAPVISGCAIGDQILVPSKGMVKEYSYKTVDKKTGWYSRQVFSDVEGLPIISAGTGFWYVSSAGSVTITW